MKTTKLTLPNNLTVIADIGSVRIMRGERNMLLLPLQALPIVRSEDVYNEPKIDETNAPDSRPPEALGIKVHGETVVYAPETFSINMGSDVGRRIACDDLRLALPEYLKATDEQLLVDVLRDKLKGKQVHLYKSPQRTDTTKYNVRLAPALAQAKDEDLLGLIKAMSVKAHDDIAGAGNYPDDANADPKF